MIEKKYSLLILAFTIMCGTIVPSLSPVKAQIGPGQVRFYIYPAVYPSQTVGTTFSVEVWIESPPEWDLTPLGIIGYNISVRVDPNVLEVVGASRIPLYQGFLENFLVTNNFFDPTQWVGVHPTAFVVGLTDKVTGTILDVSEFFSMGYEELGVGAGGGPIKLMRFVFKSLSAIAPSKIDILNLDDCARLGLDPEHAAHYTTTDGVEHPVDIVDDGDYIGFEVSEFPLGIALMLMLAPIAPIAYLWRTRKR